VRRCEFCLLLSACNSKAGDQTDFLLNACSTLSDRNGQASQRHQQQSRKNEAQAQCGGEFAPVQILTRGNAFLLTQQPCLLFVIPADEFNRAGRSDTSTPLPKDTKALEASFSVVWRRRSSSTYISTFRVTFRKRFVDRQHFPFPRAYCSNERDLERY
jgi:hypothetical protein